MKILAIGDVIVDILHIDGTTTYKNGGSAFNVAYHLNKHYSKNVHVLGVCGKDKWGDAIIENLKSEGIETKFINQNSKINTNQINMSMLKNECVYSITCPKCQQLIWKPQKISYKNINLNHFDKIVIDHVDPILSKLISQTTNKAFVSYCDIDNTSIKNSMSKEDILKFLEATNAYDYIQINGSTFKLISQLLAIKRPEEIRNYLKNPLIAITNGKHGSILLHTENGIDKTYTISNTIEKQNDNTGAGDGFMSSVIMSTTKSENGISLDIEKLQKVSDCLISKILLNIGARPEDKPLKVDFSDKDCQNCGREL